MVEEASFGGAGEVADRRDDEAALEIGGAGRRPLALHRFESGSRACRAKEQHVVRVDHRRVCGVTVSLPNRAAVEGLQASCSAAHVAKAPDPDESIRLVEVAELADHRHVDRFLCLDELAVEELDQDVSPARMERVLPELEDGAVGCGDRPRRLGAHGLHCRAGADAPAAVGFPGSPRRR
jgi:hypothetical protein